MKSRAVIRRFRAEAGNSISVNLSLGHCENTGQDLVLSTVDLEKPVQNADNRIDRFAEDVMQPSVSATAS